MRFTYTYRSSDGQRHTAEIDAPSRDEAFAAIRRELGVKPIKVVAAAGENAVNGRNARSSIGRAVALALVASLILLLAGAAWWWAARLANAPYRVITPQGPVTYTVATPLPRQTIPGDRARIAASRATAFQSPAEVWLARFAEPGRHVGESIGRAEHAGNGSDTKDPTRSHPAREEFEACLKAPIRIASSDFTEVVDLKRIVTGMKREMRAYLAGGGSVEGYLAELEKRQRLEISYRENAERKLNGLLEDSQKQPSHSFPKDTEGKPSTRNPQLSAAYSYWLKANAQLQTMGIYPLTLPDALRSYQMSLDIEE